MSGSNSSAPDASARLEPLQPVVLTVHSVDTPDLADAGPAAARRTARGRIRMLLVLLACAAPVIASYFTYYVIRPEGRTNYGTLILPTRAIPAALPLATLEGAAVQPASLKSQWLLVVVGGGACDALCEKQLFTQRQLREMLGREKDRLEKVWLIPDAAPVPALLQQAILGPAGVKTLRVPEAALAGWLAPEPGQTLSAHLYVVDPLGEWMMRFPADADPKRVKRDLDRLLRASSFWQPNKR
jgi:hypothetical protein